MNQNKNHAIETYTVKIGSFKIEFVSLFTPLKEHLRLLSVFLNLFFTVFGSTIGPFFFMFLFFYTRYWFLVPLYVAWIYYDRHTGFRGGRKIKWFRKCKIFSYYRDYFPVRLIKTADLPPNSNYLLVMYPHGVLSFSVLANFCSEANDIETEIFPGLDMRVITLDINFYCPITREYFLSIGACGASESSITYLLNEKPSKAVLLIAGGASESALARPGDTYTIIINRRKGFVRVALKCGVPLVPVFSFGENNVYDQYESKWIKVVQNIYCKLTGIMPIMPKGRGFFQHTFGILPKKAPINTVVGKPIMVPKVENPSKELIDKYHGIFVRELRQLFEDYKRKYDQAGTNATLIMT